MRTVAKGPRSATSDERRAIGPLGVRGDRAARPEENACEPRPWASPTSEDLRASEAESLAGPRRYPSSPCLRRWTPSSTSPPAASAATCPERSRRRWASPAGTADRRYSRLATRHLRLRTRSRIARLRRRRTRTAPSIVLDGHAASLLNRRTAPDGHRRHCSPNRGVTYAASAARGHRRRRRSTGERPSRRACPITQIPLGANTPRRTGSASRRSTDRDWIAQVLETSHRRRSSNAPR
jgi:hypothetical protein